MILPFRRWPSFQVWWNAWHFGSQNFGVASLVGWRARPRWLRQAAIVGATMALMLATSGLAAVIMGELLSVAHWTTDIGLTTYALRKYWWAFVPIVLSVGLIGFV